MIKQGLDHPHGKNRAPRAPLENQRRRHNKLAGGKEVLLFSSSENGHCHDLVQIVQRAQTLPRKRVIRFLVPSVGLV